MSHRSRKARGAGEHASPARRPDRKLQQLCAEALEILSLALGATTDSRLLTLAVHAVVPAVDGARLLVIVVPTTPLPPDELDQVHAALEGARPWLRQQLAAEIHRKRTPDLAFRVLPPWEDT